jgi:hypothetical protein
VNERTKELTDALASPFDPTHVKFKPAAVQGNRALALAYIDARVVQDRLDEVVGVTGWQDEYEVLQDGSVVCRLRIHLGEEWITKVDVGSPSEQPDEHDRVKAAFSDALKRAAVKFGVGRYLYKLKSTWCDYDPQKRQFRQLPQLPGVKVPQKATPAAGRKRPDVPEGERPTRETVEEIETLARTLYPDKAAWLGQALDTKFGVNQPGQLSKKEAAEVLNGLKKEQAKRSKGKKATAVAKTTNPAANGKPTVQHDPETEADLGADDGRY